MKASKLIVALLSVGLVSIASSAQAQALTGTLKKIKDTGTITLGVRDSSIPFSYIDDKQNYIGYSIDLCLKAADAVQKQLGLAKLNVKMVPVTSATRIPLITNGTVDLSCDSATNNIERQKQVAFAPTMFVTSNRILAKKSANVKSLADLKGKTVVSTSGTSNLKQLTILNGERNLGMNILAAKDHAEAFLMVETGRATAFVMDDILLSSLAASSRNPNDYFIAPEALSVEPYGIIERKDDPDFKKVVDAALAHVYQSGEVNAIYAKWFLKPVPPKGVNLNVPMSPALKAALAKPTDSGDPAAYAVEPAAQKESNKQK
ncbi:amino acid ABC transporter substrate-binding protein [Glaciimonas soli]|uniref:Transporter substrate-binding domain-containing protein n=1 Tax=Glaciimonas soli TaxID=2590999 RepID=A0A843YYG7_9BURK|nr:amino acid ABC transporter substrate-binding protein [Glaciimonas soli]MQR02301.1 transporter substrate-binding domain-containing protein [Glaciimonas soli]